MTYMNPNPNQPPPGQYPQQPQQQPYPQQYPPQPPVQPQQQPYPQQYPPQPPPQYQPQQPYSQPPVQPQQAPQLPPLPPAQAPGSSSPELPPLPQQPSGGQPAQWPQQPVQSQPQGERNGGSSIMATLVGIKDRVGVLALAVMAGLLVLGVLIGSLLSGGGSETATLNSSKVATDVTSVLENDYAIPNVLGMACPAHMEVKVNASYTCTFTAGSATDGTVAIVLSNTSGQYVVQGPKG